MIYRAFFIANFVPLNFYYANRLKVNFTVSVKNREHLSVHWFVVV